MTAKVYALYGIAANLPGHMHAANALPVGNTLRFHQRAGGHDILPSDWDAYLD